MTIRTQYFKMVLLGSFSVGKTSLITRMIDLDNKQAIETTATVGASFYTIQHQYDDKHHFVVNIWDTAGQERFRSITTIYFNGVDIALIVYDMNEINSLLEVEKYWLVSFYEDRYIKELRQSDLILFVIGNKTDLYYDNKGQPNNPDLETKRLEVLSRLKTKYPLIHFMEVSAHTTYNIDVLQINILDKLTEYLKNTIIKSERADKTIIKLSSNGLIDQKVLVPISRRRWC